MKSPSSVKSFAKKSCKSKPKSHVICRVQLVDNDAFVDPDDEADAYVDAVVIDAPNNSEPSQKPTEEEQPSEEKKNQVKKKKSRVKSNCACTARFISVCCAKPTSKQ